MPYRFKETKKAENLVPGDTFEHKYGCFDYPLLVKVVFNDGAPKPGEGCWNAVNLQVNDLENGGRIACCLSPGEEIHCLEQYHGMETYVERASDDAFSWFAGGGN